MTRRGCDFCLPESFQDRIIYEGPLAISFLSDPKLVRGHALVVPRRHVVPDIDIVRDPEAVAIQEEIERLRSTMLGSSAIRALGVDVFQKTRSQVPQGHNGTKMNHLHQHVLPSRPGDELYDRGIIWGDPSNWQPLGTEERDEMVKALRESL